MVTAPTHLLTDPERRNVAQWNVWRTENPIRGANLWGANLGGANLWGANLGGANLRGANLWDAYANERTIVPSGWVVANGRIEKAR